MWERAQRLLRGEGTRSAPHTAFRTRRGATHRVNQDAGGAWSAKRPSGVHAGLIVVADGVSAVPSSEDASNLVVERMRDALLPYLAEEDATIDFFADRLLSVARAADDEIADIERSGNATTIVAAAALGTQGAGVWCGDSRAYLVRSRSVQPLTSDHSWATDMVRSGVMTSEQAAVSPRAHMITGWLGFPRDGHRPPEGFRFHAEPGDVVLCCSDGLYGYFLEPYEEAEIASILAHAPDLEDAANRLTATAVQRGGHDDITVALMRIEG